MECKDAEQLVQRYIKGNLEGKQLKKFVEHVQTCKNCFEEMEIYYMVFEGLQHLESGASINIGKEISSRLMQSERKIRNNSLFRFYYYIMQITAYGVLLLTLFLAVY